MTSQWPSVLNQLSAKGRHRLWTSISHTRRNCQQTSLNACTRNLYVRLLRRSFTSASGMGDFTSRSNGPPSLQCDMQWVWLQRHGNLPMYAPFTPGHPAGWHRAALAAHHSEELSVGALIM